MMKIFDESDWFWIVTSNPNEAYSSKTNKFVLVESSIFMEWRKNGGIPSIVNSRDELNFIIKEIRIKKISNESTRRIIAATRARDLDHCFAKQLNAQMRAMELTRKRMGEDGLTDEEIAEERDLIALAETIKNIRAKSNLFGAIIPDDYQDDKYW